MFGYRKVAVMAKPYVNGFLVDVGFRNAKVSVLGCPLVDDGAIV